MMRLLVLMCIFFVAICDLRAQENRYFTSKWRISASAGGGYLLAGTKQTAKYFENYLGIDYLQAKKGLDQLKWHLQLGGDIHYFIGTNWGVGVKYLHSNSHGNIDDVTAYINNMIGSISGDIEYRYYVNYIGPSFIGRSFLGTDKRFELTGLASIGYSHLRMEQLAFNYPMLGEKSALGMYTSIGLGYYLTNQISLGCDLGVFVSSFHKLSYNDSGDLYVYMDFEDYRNHVSNINLSVSVRIHL